MVQGPTLVSCSATATETLVVTVGGAAHVFVNKDHRGGPWRELETFTVPDVVASLGGPYFFNVRPVRVERLDQTFNLTTAFSPNTNTVRFFWNPGSSYELRYMDYNVSTRQTESPVVLPFEGRDPFIVEAQVPGDEQRIYMTYLTRDGANEARISRNNGTTWGGPRTVDPGAAGVVEQESMLEDAIGERTDVCVTQRRG